MPPSGLTTAMSARRARPFAVALALALLAAQSLLLTHAHAEEARGDHGPGAEAAHVCDLCVAFTASAPPPAAATAATVEAAAITLPASRTAPVATFLRGAGHRSRAPPLVRSA